MKAKGTKLPLIVARSIFLSKTKIWKPRAMSGAIVLWRGMYPFYSCQCLNIGLKIFSINKIMTSPWKIGAHQKKYKDQFSIKTSGIDILFNKGTQLDIHFVNCSSPFKYTGYVKVQILTVKFGKSVILGWKFSFSDFLMSYKNGLQN